MIVSFSDDVSPGEWERPQPPTRLRAGCLLSCGSQPDRIRRRYLPRSSGKPQAVSNTRHRNDHFLIVRVSGQVPFQRLNEPIQFVRVNQPIVAPEQRGQLFSSHDLPSIPRQPAKDPPFRSGQCEPPASKRDDVKAVFQHQLTVQVAFPYMSKLTPP